MLTTPKLPAPFKFIKSMTHPLPFLDHRVRDQWEGGKIHLYLDPRGSAGFAIGIAPEIGDLLGQWVSRDGHSDRTDQIHQGKASGLYFLKADTAEDVVAAAGRVFRAYVEKLNALNSKEVIEIAFDAVCPEYDAAGEATGEHVYKAYNTRFGGSAGITTELHFACQRGWQIGHDFFVEREGRKVKCYSRSGSMTIPFDQEVWDQLVKIRDTITHAAMTLGKIVKGGAKEDIRERLLGAMGQPLLSPPAPPVEEVMANAVADSMAARGIDVAEVHVGGKLIRRRK